MSLDLLSNTATLGQALQKLQEQMAEIRQEIAVLKRPSSPPPATPTPSLDKARAGTPEYLPSTRIPRTSWSEEMDIVQPLDSNNTPEANVTCIEGAHVAEVSETTQELLKRSFMSLKNAKRSRSGTSMRYRR